VRAWSIATTTTLCGGRHDIPRPIAKGERMQLVTLPLVKQARIRCQECAEEVLDALVPDPPKPLGVDFTAIGKVDTPLTRDWKALQVSRDGAA